MSKLASNVWRTELIPEQREAAFWPPLSALPPALRGAEAFHVAVHPEQPLLRHLQELRRANYSGLISLETYAPASRPLPPQDLRNLLSLCDIFSPNETEALSMLRSTPGHAEPATAIEEADPHTIQQAIEQQDIEKEAGPSRSSGDTSSGGGGTSTTSSSSRSSKGRGSGGGSSTHGMGNPGARMSRKGAGDHSQGELRLTRPFLEAGALVVAIRRGPLGAIVHSREEGAWQVPAVPGTLAVDTTGCGNAFCGAMLAALQAGAGLPVAGAWGCVAGSLMAEARGIPKEPPGELYGEARRRLSLLLPLVRSLGAGL
ncbi:hypothetical protein N2152v2_006547 [Parachlorella kessleri]